MRPHDIAAPKITISNSCGFFCLSVCRPYFLCFCFVSGCHSRLTFRRIVQPLEHRRKIKTCFLPTEDLTQIAEVAKSTELLKSFDDGVLHLRPLSFCALSVMSYSKQDRQCTYNNVTLRRVSRIIFAVEKQYVLYTCLCVCAHVSACVHVRAWVGE